MNISLTTAAQQIIRLNEYDGLRRVAKYYNGNISVQAWQSSSDSNNRGYKFTYDNLNYPKEVQFTNGNRIQYVYSPDGQKLRATYQTAVANIVVPLNSTKSLSNSQIS